MNQRVQLELLRSALKFATVMPVRNSRADYEISSVRTYS